LPKGRVSGDETLNRLRPYAGRISGLLFSSIAP
jgi:hypothetical protein